MATLIRIKLEVLFGRRPLPTVLVLVLPTPWRQRAWDLLQRPITGIACVSIWYRLRVNYVSMEEAN
jgi:hypothetical protein